MQDRCERAFSGHSRAHNATDSAKPVRFTEHHIGTACLCQIPDVTRSYIARPSTPGFWPAQASGAIRGNIDDSGCGTTLAGERPVQRPDDSDDSTVLRLPRPPKAARVALDGSQLESGIVAIPGGSGGNAPSGISELLPAPMRYDVANLAPMTTASAQQVPAESPRRPSLEILLGRAESLANALSISDPRGRLLQIALLRRDHTLLEAIVRTVDVALATKQRASTAPRGTARSTTVRPGKPPQPMRRRRTDRPATISRRPR